VEAFCIGLMSITKDPACNGGTYSECHNPEVALFAGSLDAKQLH